MARKQTSQAKKATPNADLDALVDAAARAFDLPIEDAWKAAIKFNLAVTLSHAANVAGFELPDDTEQAPVFRVKP